MSRSNVSFIYLILDQQILNLFTDYRNVLDQAGSVVIWTVLAPLVSSICYIWDGVYIGATATKPMRNTMLIATLIFYLPARYIATPHIQEHGLWFALVLFMIVRGVALTLTAPRFIFNRS